MNKVKIASIPFALQGEMIKVGSPLSFKAIDKDGKEFSSDFKGAKIVSVFPDISTRVCDMQTHEVAKLAGKYPKAHFISISVDSIEVIKQWCAANGFANLVIVSDEKMHDFANKTNLLIKKTKRLARCVLLVDENNVLKDIVMDEEIKNMPDFKRVEE